MVLIDMLEAPVNSLLLLIKGDLVVNAVLLQDGAYFVLMVGRQFDLDPLLFGLRDVFQGV